jgi:hypothetical protein
MKNTTPIYIALGVGIAAALGLYNTKSYASQIIDIKAGETWQITMKGVNSKLSQDNISRITKGMEAMGYAGITIVPNADMTEAVMTLKSPTNDKIVLNKMIPNLIDSSKGVIYSAATKLDGPAVLPPS